MAPSDLERRFGTILGAGVDPQDTTFFHTQPWSREWLVNNHYSAISITSRAKKTSGQDDFFAKTLQTASTIPYWLYLVHNAFLSNSARTDIPGRELPDIILFVKLEQGINGFRDTAHGGVLCGLLDEVQSTCVEFYRRIPSPATDILYTARLSVEFRRPVRTPSVVMVRAWLSGAEGRKWHVNGEIVDSTGQILAESSSLWISPRRDRL